MVKFSRINYQFLFGRP